MRMLGGIEEAAAPFTAFIEANAAFAGPIVFAITFLESLAIVSAVIPATLLLIGIGSLAAAGVVDLGALSLWGIAGGGLGYWASYEAGRRWGDRIESISWLARRPHLIAGAHRLFERWGVLAVFVSRFIGPGRIVAPLLAGTLGVRQRGFQLANWASAILWAPMLLAPTTIGAWLTEQLERLPPTARSSILIGLLGVTVVAILALRQRRTDR
jgi:membrane protein DedA with SNARE-associated domain